MEFMSRMLASEFYGNSLRGYLVTLVIIIATLVAALVVNRYLKKKLEEWAGKTDTQLDDFILKRIFPPIVYLVVIIGLTVSTRHLILAPAVSMWLDKILLAAGLAVFFLLVIRLLKGLVAMIASAYVEKLEKEPPQDLEEQKKLVERIRKQVSEVLNMVLVVLAILTILSNLGVDLKAIWASLGIGGIALVVAVKDPLSNLVGRMYIYSTGIFDEGHFIVFNGYGGTVKRISIFRTYLELFSDMTTLSVPNADFVKGAVQNYYGRTKYMYKWDLDVPYEVSAEAVRELLVKLRELVLGHPEVNAESSWIYLDRMGAHSKVVRVWFQANLATWSESLFYGSRMLHEIQLLFESMGLAFAFPTQTVELKYVDRSNASSAAEVLPAALPEPGD